MPKFAVAFVLMLGTGLPQSPPAFEAASIRRSERLDQVGDLGLQPGSGLRTINMPPLVLISVSYRVQMNQIVNAPDWLRTDRYDILAKAPEGTPSGAEPLFAMIRSLFQDRFGLRVRRDVREMPVYRLVRARTDGSLGPQLRRVDDDCSAQLGTQANQRCTSRMAPGVFLMFGYPLRTLTVSLAQFVDRPIVDQTGLTGNWEARLEWTPDRIAPDAPAPARDAPSLLTALQEQLGLKMEAARGPVEVLVIESVSRPTDN